MLRIVGSGDVLHEAAFGRAADGSSHAEEGVNGGEEARGAVGVRGRVEADSLSLVVGKPDMRANGIIWVVAGSVRTTGGKVTSYSSYLTG